MPRLDSRGIVTTLGPDADRGVSDSPFGMVANRCVSWLRSVRPRVAAEAALPRFDSLGMVITDGPDDRGESDSPLGTAINLELLWSSDGPRLPRPSRLPESREGVEGLDSCLGADSSLERFGVTDSFDRRSEPELLPRDSVFPRDSRPRMV